MVANFSSAYYLTQLLITPHRGERAIVQTDWFEQFQRKYSHTRPLVMKVENLHIPVYEEFSVPSQVLAVPEETYSELDVNSDEPTNVLLAKEEIVDRLVEMSLVDVDGE